MPRPNKSLERSRELIPIVARTFAELGFRRATTAELAQRCGVQENTLYRIWPDKKAMFIAAIEYVYDLSATIWGKLLAEDDGDGDAATRLLEYESSHHGEFGLYRIIHAGLSEIDHPDVRAALAEMYQRYHRFISRQVAARPGSTTAPEARANMVAWAVIGLGTVANIGRELGLLNDSARQKLLLGMGNVLLGEKHA